MYVSRSARSVSLTSRLPKPCGEKKDGEAPKADARCCGHPACRPTPFEPKGWVVVLCLVWCSRLREQQNGCGSAAVGRAGAHHAA